MPMPEAPMHEDHGLVLWQDNVGFAGQGVDVDAETVAHAVQHRADDQFRLCVAAFDPGHVPTAMLFADPVHDYFSRS